MPYAENTGVSIERSRMEIEGILRRYGAQGFNYGWVEPKDPKMARVEKIDFIANDRHIRFMLELPRSDDPQFLKTPQGRNRSKPNAALQALEQSCRQKWRALCLCIKAKLEAVDAGISQFEDEFLAQIVVEGTDKTVANLLRPWISGEVQASKLLRLTGPEQSTGSKT
jgi:hypothetical protein